MLHHYLILGLTPEANSEQIKNRYLELVKTFPPEKEPEKFRQINTAYEALKNRRNRIKSRMFSGVDTVDMEKALLELSSSLIFKKKRSALEDLITASGLSHKKD